MRSVNYTIGGFFKMKSCCTSHRSIILCQVCKHCNCNYNITTIKDGPYDMPPLLPKDPNKCDQVKSQHYHQSYCPFVINISYFDVSINSSAIMILSYTSGRMIAQKSSESA